MFNAFVSQTVFFTSFLVIGYVLGKGTLRNSLFLSKIERITFVTGFGWAILALLMMLLGFSGLLRPWVLSLIFAFIFIASLLYVVFNKSLRVQEDVFSFKSPISDSFWAVIVVLIILNFILLFYTTLYPVTEWDAVSYHLPVAKEFIVHGGIVPMPFIRFPVGPQLTELLFSLALFFKNPLFANVIQFSTTILLFLLIYSFSQRYFNKTIGLFSGLIFLSSPVVTKFSVIPYVEINTTLFCFFAFYSILIWVTEKKLYYALLGAVFGGIALASKYYAAPFLAISFLSMIIIFRSALKPGHLVIFFSVLLLIALPWYFRNKIYSGDLFFPFRPVTGMWHSQDVVNHLNYMQSLGMGRDPMSFLRLPINLLTHSDKFQEEIGPLLMTGLASLFFIRKYTRLVWLCVIIALSYIIMWFFSFQVLRYMFPVFPLLALLGGWTLQEVCYSLDLKGKLLERILVIGLLMLCSFNCFSVIRRNGFIPITHDQKFEYIAARIPTFRAIDFLNNIVKRDAIVYALCDEGAVFYYKDKVIGDWYGKAAYSGIFPFLEKPVLLHNILKEYGADYFLVRKKKNLHIDWRDQNDFKLIYTDPNADVFKVL